jgi:hypothetical protein
MKRLDSRFIFRVFIGSMNHGSKRHSLGDSALHYDYLFQPKRELYQHEATLANAFAKTTALFCFLKFYIVHHIDMLPWSETK